MKKNIIIALATLGFVTQAPAAFMRTRNLLSRAFNCLTPTQKLFVALGSGTLGLNATYGAQVDSYEQKRCMPSFATESTLKGVSKGDHFSTLSVINGKQQPVTYAIMNGQHATHMTIVGHKCVLSGDGVDCDGRRVLSVAPHFSVTSDDIENVSWMRRIRYGRDLFWNRLNTVFSRR